MLPWEGVFPFLRKILEIAVIFVNPRRQFGSKKPKDEPLVVGAVEDSAV